MQCCIFYSVTVLSFKCDFPVALCMFERDRRERVFVCVCLCAHVCWYLLKSKWQCESVFSMKVSGT